MSRPKDQDVLLNSPRTTDANIKRKPPKMPRFRRCCVPGADPVWMCFLYERWRSHSKKKYQPMAVTAKVGEMNFGISTTSIKPSNRRQTTMRRARARTGQPYRGDVGNANSDGAKFLSPSPQTAQAAAAWSGVSVINTNQPPSGSGPGGCQSITARCVPDKRKSQPRARVSLAPVISASVKVQLRNVVRRKSAPRSVVARKLTRSKMEALKSTRDKSAELKSTSMKSFQLAVDSERSEPRNETLRISDRPKKVRGNVRPSRATSASRVRKKLTPRCSSSWRGGRSGSGGSSFVSRSSLL
jgi:hypothetical protein